MPRRKSLLIGINYTGSQHALFGCHNDVENVAEFITSRGYTSDSHDQIVMRDDLEGPYYPSGHNILAAMVWLVSEPGCACFLHYSGHGGQVQVSDGDDASAFNDTIVPVDFETNGQINSDTLHQHLVSSLHPNSTLFVIFDCCHSGSAIQLPFIYRADGEGKMTLVDDLHAGISLIDQAYHVVKGGFSFNEDRVAETKQLYAETREFFKSLSLANEQTPGDDGLREEHFAEDWSQEHKMVTMFSGCRDDQTSADSNILGTSEGAMSWAFLQVMGKTKSPTYIQTLLDTRAFLKQSQYQQIPQLSAGMKMDFNIALVL